MLTIKPIANNKASFDYFTKDNYYTTEEGVEHSQWFGELSRDLELSGKIDPETFEGFYSGRVEGQQLGNVKDGQVRHRPGYDFTFSAPKSVSILGEVFGKEDVLKAHDDAVRDTLTFIEQHYVATRLKRGDDIRVEKSGKGLFAVFRHDVSRELDPQTHSHALLLNVTHHADKYRSIHPDVFLPYVKQLGMLYRMRLAQNLREYGYQLKYTDKRQGFFEIEQVPESYLELFSKRAQQIKQYIKDKGAEYNPALAQRVSIITRKSKRSLSRDELKAMWRSELEEAELTPLKEKGVSIDKQPELDGDDLTALVKRGVRRKQSTDIAFTEVDLIASCKEIADAKKQEINGYDLSSKIKEFINKGTLLLADMPRGKTDELYFTTRAAKAFEKEILERFKASFNVFESGYMEKEKVLSALARFEGKAKPKKYTPLDEGKRNAVVEALTSRDRYHIIQGNAGAGKTTLLKELRELVVKELGVIIRRQKGQLRAFASTHVAVNELSQSLGVDAMTVDSFLVRTSDDELKKSKGEVWIVDEMSMTDVKKLKSLMEKAELSEARVIFVGDVNQLESVGPGRALYMAQKAGVSMSVVNKIYRQQNEKLREVAELFNAQEHGSALDQLQALGAVVESGEGGKGENPVVDRIQDYLFSLDGQKVANTVVVVPANEDRDALNQGIRAILQDKGIVRKGGFTLTTLSSKIIPDVEMKFSDQYQIGDVIRFNRRFEVDSGRWQRHLIKSGEYFDVIGLSKGELLVKSRTTKARFKFDLSLLGDRANGAVFVYEAKKIEVSVGDRLRWLDNKNKHGLMRNHVVTVEGVSQNGLLVSHNGKCIELDLHEFNQQHFEHQYAVTAHGAQGMSADSVIVAAPYWRKNSVNQRSLLVGATRAKKSLLVFTENLGKLKSSLVDRYADNSMALRKREAKSILTPGLSL